jgi:hypothetical protein
MAPKSSKAFLWILALLLIAAPAAWAGNKKVMTTRAAKVLAERAIVESIFGLKIRATESVQDMIAASFEGKTESKTEAQISGVQIEEIVYDPEKDIAKATAFVSLPSITNIDGETLNLKNKVFKRVAFATSTPSQAGPIKALRAAELDAYKQLAKSIVGFTLESQTTVENYMLKSDLVKTKVMATLYLSELMDYGWDENGDAFVKMGLNVKDISELLGEKVQSDQEVLVVEGQGASVNDFSAAKAEKGPADAGHAAGPKP